MTAQSNREALLRAALRTSTGDPELDELLNASMYAGTIRTVRDRQIWREETAPPQVALDLHLEGEGVAGHATGAMAFGEFVHSLASAAKSVAHRLPGRASGPMIEGATPGSVRIVLQAPEASGLTFEGDSADSLALRRIGQTLGVASEDDLGEDDPTLAAVAVLPAAARSRLAKAMSVAIGADWEIRGAARQLRRTEEPVRMTRRGAQHLLDALRSKPDQHRVYKTEGVLDGFRHGAALAFIKPQKGRDLSLYVPDPTVFGQVVNLAAVRERPVQVTIEEWRPVREDGTLGPLSRSLKTIRDLEAPKGGGEQSAFF